jgi:hypothetical protein
MNGLTAYIDGSNIYGSDSGNATELKALTGVNVIEQFFSSSLMF